MNNVQSASCLKSLWQSCEASSKSSQAAITSSSSLFASLMELSSKNVNWMIENRGGFAKLVGLMMVPSQFLGPDLERCQQIINDACQNGYDGYAVNKFRTEDMDGLEGVICYPPGWDLSDNSRAVLYHNPNGITVAQFFEEGRLSWTAGDILDLKQCPVILYDYRGTGLNQGECCSSSLRFRPTYETVVTDGLSVLKYVLNRFDNVDVWGSSLGGGVATVSLERYLKENPDDTERLNLVNHDSFTKTPRVVLPNQPYVADALGWMFGGNLDAQTPMGSLIDRGIKVTVLYHQRDPVIPPGARMAEFVSQLGDRDNVSVISSPQYGHANLSFDMIGEIVTIY